MEEEKPGLAIMIAKKEKPEEEEEGADYAEMAKEILQAVKDDDAEGLAESLKNFIETC